MMRRRLLGGVFPINFSVVFFLTLFFASSVGAQGGIPLTLPLFQNNDASCQDENVVDDAFSATCGQMTDDSAAGNPDFPDCIGITENSPAFLGPNNPFDLATYYQNQNFHNSNNCTSQMQFDAGTILQFQPMTPGITPSNSFNGSVLNANFDGTNFNDFAFPNYGDPGNFPPFAEVFLGAPGGGFSSPGIFGTNLFANPLNIAAETNNFSVGTFRIDPFNPFAYDFPVQNCFPSVGSQNLGLCAADKSNLVHDCNNDGTPDLTTAVGFGMILGADNRVFLRTLLNNGSGLAGPPLSTEVRNLGNIDDEVIAVSLAEGDFNNDGIMDVVASLFSDIPSVLSEVIVCTHGADPNTCSFTCNTVVDLESIITDGNLSYLYPFSIAAGDFNGDNQDDAAVTIFGVDNNFFLLSRLLYLFGDGSGAFPSNQQVSTVNDNGSALLSINGMDFTNMGPTSLTSGQFDNDGIPDLALTNFHARPDRTPAPNPFDNVRQGDVVVFTSNGTSGAGFTPQPTVLQFPTQDLRDQVGNNLPTTPTTRASGIASGDFDHCGGDDLVALSELCLPTSPNPPPGTVDPQTGECITTIQRIASFFLNANEAPEVTAAVDPQIESGVSIPLTASCADPTQDERTLTWTVISAPAGSNVVFDNPSGTLTGIDTDASTNFTADLTGDYIFELNCVDFCDMATAVTVQTSVIFAFTQGSNLFNCSLTHGPTGKGKSMAWMMIFLMPTLFLFRRWGRKGLIVSLLVLGMGMTNIVPTYALTPSVNVNSFEPAMDDSEYFSMYSSPTMLRRNFHVGFYLDYAHNPYEFGTANFNRVSGIVDHLLDANVVRSYGILDCFTAGVVIPVHLYEGINSPLLGLNESNFALGDVKLLLKFRLLNRETKHIGISIVPFVSFPTSTNSGDFLGAGSWRAGAILVIDGRIADRVSIALNAGYNFRNKFVDVGGNTINDEFMASLGISVDILKRVFKFIGEARTATVVNNFYSDKRTTQGETRLGFRYTWAKNHDINAGVGLGFLNGIGQPDIRGFVGYTYTKRPLVDVTAPQPPMSEIQVGDELTLKDKIYFEFDKASIRDISQPTLDKIAGFLKAHPEVTKIKIDGYTCDLGTASYNMGLSKRRAKSVENYLEAQGISPDRIGTVQGFGESDPLVPNTDEANREQNRRVQIFVQEVANQ